MCRFAGAISFRKKSGISAVARRVSLLYRPRLDADVVELVDTLDLGSSAARRGGSSPFIRTNKQALICLK